MQISLFTDDSTVRLLEKSKIVKNSVVSETTEGHDYKIKLNNNFTFT
jgi:hypothetical protein